MERPKIRQKQHFRFFLVILLIFFLLENFSFAQFTFYLIDNFESGKTEKWWKFGEIVLEAAKNPKVEIRDLVTQSCGDYALRVWGNTFNWYVGGIGAYLGIDARTYSRIQLDIYGNEKFGGKLKIELFDDDNKNFNLEQDSQNNYEPIYDDKWVTEVGILGPGFTRLSIPFTAFQDANPGIGDGKWNPWQNDGSGGLLQLQLVFLAEKEKGGIDFKVDNILLTY